jgi:hypothetical protein
MHVLLGGGGGGGQVIALSYNTSTLQWRVLAHSDYNFIVLPVSMKLLDIMKWADKEGTIHKYRLLDEISSKWRAIGLIIGLSMNVLDRFSVESSDNNRSCIQKVLDKWLNRGDGCHYSPTWHGLFALLRDVDMPRCADELKHALERISSV